MGETVEKEPAAAGDILEFQPHSVMTASSPARAGGIDGRNAADLKGPHEASVGEAELSPVFRELAEPKLPSLTRENRARLQMQSPRRLFFYWSLRNNPFQTLNRALGAQTGSYTLVLKLVDLRRDVESIYPADADGARWFDVEADSDYRAEVGLYAPNRPYIRILFSNTVNTPRQSPSPRSSDSAHWGVSSVNFSRILDAAGFSRDAFDVALAGDDHENEELTARAAFARVAGDNDEVPTANSSELRYVLLALASGMAIEELRSRINARLFAYLLTNAERLSSERALAALREEYGVEAEDVREESAGAAVFGASLVNFPRVLRKRRSFGPGPSPVSSFSVGS